MTALRRRGDRAMKERYDSAAPLLSGETVTAGRFECSRCGYVHQQKTGVKNLPVCPRCQGDEWQLK